MLKDGICGLSDIPQHWPLGRQANSGVPAVPDIRSNKGSVTVSGTVAAEGYFPGKHQGQSRASAGGVLLPTRGRRVARIR